MMQVVETLLQCGAVLGVVVLVTMRMYALVRDALTEETTMPFSNALPTTPGEYWVRHKESGREFAWTVGPDGAGTVWELDELEYGSRQPTQAELDELRAMFPTLREWARRAWGEGDYTLEEVRGTLARLRVILDIPTESKPAAG